MRCAAETGTCRLPDASDQPALAATPLIDAPTVHYIGDPMCSWCWGVAPALHDVASYCLGRDVGFGVHVGGLRPGGGDEWSPRFKAFLRHEWETIQRVTGQPFGLSLLDRPNFDYDTEPACRAVVAMAEVLRGKQKDNRALLAFFSSIQRRFYVDGADPKEPEFYRELSLMANVAYDDFLTVFLADATKLRTLQEFQLCRSWGVHGFPSVVLEMKGRIVPVASGYASREVLIERLDALLGAVR